MTITEVFSKSKSANKKVFIPFITAGDPDLKSTALFLQALQKGGAGVIELGIPFSDPVADGPTIQRSSERALKNNVTLIDILDFVKNLRNKEHFKTPLVLFSYFNPIFKMGVETFCKRAKESGVQGVLVVDLPPEEATDFVKCARENAIETIFLASPTTTAERIKIVSSHSSGFLYYVSRLGVTGAQKNLSQNLSESLERLKKLTDKPIAVGFGISTPEQAKSVAADCDGVVVGSAIVEIIQNAKTVNSAVNALETFAQKMVQALS